MATKPKRNSGPSLPEQNLLAAVSGVENGHDLIAKNAPIVTRGIEDLHRRLAESEDAHDETRAEHARTISALEDKHNAEVAKLSGKLAEQHEAFTVRENQIKQRLAEARAQLRQVGGIVGAPVKDNLADLGAL